MELTVERLVRERIDQMDIEYYVRESVRALVSDQVKAAIKPILDQELKIIIQNEIEIIFTTEVTTDDGWGNRVTYSTFEALFKAEFQKKLNDTYQVKRTIEGLVKDRVTALINQEYSTVVETIVDTITKSKLVKNK